MSDEKIDLAAIEEDAREHWVMRREDTLALVAAVRAAIRLDAAPTGFDWVDRYKELRKTIAPFTDSAEDK